MSDEQGHTMQCTEIWGGNTAVDHSVVTWGLDAWVYSRPYEGDQEGGDIHYLSACSTGRITRLLVADVSGHGKVVADMAQRLKMLMRRYMNYIDQRRLVEGLNKEFGGLAKAGHFATAVVATYWSPSRELETTNAGHPQPMLFRAETQRWEPLTSSNGRPASDDPADLPLGILDITQYARSRVKLNPGDRLLFYTDALIEARDAGGRMLGVEGLAEVLNRVSPQPAPRLIPKLLEAVGSGPTGAALDDDTTLLLVQLNDRAVRSCVLEGFRATVRLVTEFVRSFKRGSGPFPMPEISWPNLAGIWDPNWNRRTK